MSSTEERVAALEEAHLGTLRTFAGIATQNAATASQLSGISRHLAEQEGAFGAVKDDVRAIKESSVSLAVAANQVVQATNGGIRGAAQRAAMPLAGGGAVFGLVELLRAAGIIAGG